MEKWDVSLKLQKVISLMSAGISDLVRVHTDLRRENKKVNTCSESTFIRVHCGRITAGSFYPVIPQR